MIFGEKSIQSAGSKDATRATEEFKRSPPKNDLGGLMQGVG